MKADATSANISEHSVQIGSGIGLRLTFTADCKRQTSNLILRSTVSCSKLVQSVLKNYVCIKYGLATRVETFENLQNLPSSAI
jgi:hypothetical protein